MKCGQRNSFIFVDFLSPTLKNDNGSVIRAHSYKKLSYFV